ncbi:MAG: hypothetical protein KatS3mg115_1163 [Candidatus Poribacteria bacterium]|nr:MAG: hypothetical protein KatS3mg115_1163 [Candidatus Poribacteria bacterium]
MGASIFDCVAQFAEATVQGGLETTASDRQVSGGVALPGIFHHPQGEDWARLSYEVELSPLSEGERVVLLFAVGIRDGARLDDPAAPFDGVTCAVEVNGRRLLEAAVHGPGWRWYSLDLSRFGGRKVVLTFAVHGNDNTNYDWFFVGAASPLSVDPDRRGGAA